MAKKTRNRELSVRQLKFVQEYMIDQCASKAYVRAGYSNANPETGACRLMRNPKVQQAIDTETKKIQKRVAWDATYVRNQLAWLANEAKEKGNLAVLRATLDTMSKCEGMQVQNHNVNNNERIQFNITTGRGERIVRDDNDDGAGLEHAGNKGKWQENGELGNSLLPPRTQ